jgi:glycerol-3-phosphate dehydrogenase
MKTETCDLLVIGGGVNGAGIAADAAGRGLSVMLCEMNDLASATSSQSSKLIHGGLRYLEYYEFRLVREALREREVLLRNAPHLIKPMRFILPHMKHLRPAWMIRAGLFLYDNLGRRKALEGSNKLQFGQDSPLKPWIKKGFEYADCWVDDARLVVLNCMMAAEKGARILTRTRLTGARRTPDGWCCTLEDQQTRQRRQVLAHGVANAAGPWVDQVIRDGMGLKPAYGVRLIKGSHIVVPRIHDQPQAYILQNDDKRIVFVIPYLEDFSLVGTTDVVHKGGPETVAIDAKEIRYLCDIVNEYFRAHIQPDDVLFTFSGVRPLCDDESDSPSAITRDYTLTVEDDNGRHPLLNVFGGKLTTYRRLASSAMARLAPYYPDMGPPWTRFATLPGGAFENGIDDFRMRLGRRYAFLDNRTLRRLSDAYGVRCLEFLGDARCLEDLGEHFGCQLTENEVRYLIRHEWACTAEDVLFRRSKLGLSLDRAAQMHLTRWMESFVATEPLPDNQS